MPNNPITPTTPDGDLHRHSWVLMSSDNVSQEAEVCLICGQWRTFNED